MCTPPTMISHRCLRSVKLHHLSPQTNTLLLWTVNINTRLTVNSPTSARNVCPQAKITPQPKISQNKPIRSFILALLQSRLGDLRVTVRCIVIRYTWAIYMLFYEAESAFTLSIPPHKRWHIPRFYSTSGPFMFGWRVLDEDSSFLCSSSTQSDFFCSSFTQKKKRNYQINAKKTLFNRCIYCLLLLCKLL